MLWLQILFPVLVVACALVGRVALRLWNKSSALSEAGTVAVPLLLLLFYLYTGISIKDGLSPEIRPYFVRAILQNGSTLLALCACLTVLLLALIWLSTASETLSFVSDGNAEIAVERLKGEKAVLLGHTSSSQPLTRRFLAGQHHFRFASEGFETTDLTVQVARAGLNEVARRIPVSLHPLPLFTLRDVQTFPANFYGFPEDFHVPAHLKEHDTLNLSLTLAGSSPTPLWIQSVALRVTDAKPLRMATFPLEGLGGDGAAPILGWVELKPQLGSYSVVAQSKAQLGRGIAPDDYRLQVFSPTGYEYSALVEVTWADMQDQRREGHFAFEKPLALEFPRVVEWKEFVRGARELKILYDASLHIVLPWIRFEQPAPQYTALVPQGGFGLDAKETALLPRVAVLSEHDGAPLYKLLSQNQKSESPRQFILIDSRVLLIHSPEHIHLAEVVEDPARIAAIESTFDALASRLLK